MDTKLEMTGSIPRGEWTELLGVRGGADPVLEAQMDEAETLLMKTAKPRGVYRIMELGGIQIPGMSLSRHLAGCSRAAVMAVTLGADVDSLIRKLQIRDMAAAVVTDMGASVLAEAVCGQYERYIRSVTEGYTTGRFSPGYGDSPLSMQKDVVRFVDGQRKIGLNVTADNLLIPRKSITAVIGISGRPVKGRPATCAECVLREKCAVRKEGGYCGDRFQEEDIYT